MATQARPQAKAPVPSSKREDPQTSKLIIFIVAAAVSLALPFIARPVLEIFGPRTFSDIFSPINTALIYVLLALGLNIVTGYAGLLDLGYSAFFAIGAYTMGFLTAQQTPWYKDFHVDFWIALPICFVVAAIFGIMLGAPTLGLKGDYLAIVTLGFGEIVPITFQNLNKITQGDSGLAGFVQPSFFGFQFTASTLEAWYLMALAVLILSIFIIRRLVDSRMGRAWMAIREDEIAASAMGISLVKTKLLAFAMGASFAGFAGGIFANSLGSANPSQFKFDVSILVLCMIILGGMGNLWGVIFGAFTLVLLDRTIIPFFTGFVKDFANTMPRGTSDNPNFIKDFVTNVGENSRLLIFGLILVIMMLIRPEGLFPSGRRKMELRAGREDDVQAFVAQSEDPLERAEESHSINRNISITESSDNRTKLVQKGWEKVYLERNLSLVALTLGGAVLLFIGAFLPWATKDDYSASGLGMVSSGNVVVASVLGDGILAIGCAILIVILVAGAYFSQIRWLVRLANIVAGFATFVMIVGFVNVGGHLLTIGLGIWIGLIGAITALVSGILCLKEKNN